MAPLPPTRERPLAATPAAMPGAPSAPPRRRWLRRVGITLLVLLAVLLGAFAAVFLVTKQEIDDFVTPKNAAMKAAQAQLAEPLPGKPTNILLLGSDHRGDSKDPSDKRSDTLLLVRLDPTRTTISMLSFPRDLYVSIPGHGESKINDAYSLGGPALSVKTVKEVTGLDVNFVMNVDFDGFRGVVNTLGGVWADVDRTYYNPEGTGFAAIDIEPGYQLLMGEDALQYARFRHDQRGDFSRIARQQQLVTGLKKQVSGSSVARNVPGLFRVLTKNTEVVGGGGGGVPARVLYDYMRLALSLEGKDIYQVEYEGNTGESPAGASIVVFDERAMEAAVEAFLSPSSTAREQTADQLVGVATEAEAPGGVADEAAAEEPAAPDPANVTVTVKNGSGRSGAAGSLGDQLREAGYKVTVPEGEAGNADTFAYANTRVQYSVPRAKAAAEALADRIDGASAEPVTEANPVDTQLLVIAGKAGTTIGAAADGAGSHDSSTPYDGNVVPPKAAAKVTRDPQYAREQFTAVGVRKLPVMYPTIREESSTYEGVRAYRIAKGEKGGKDASVYEAYRLVAQTAGGDYWGVQGTTWTAPPILEGPTREVTRRGRRYLLFFNGTKLHMVAWREGAGTYWVSNSVLDQLSNETMLAIADGMQRLA